MGDAEAVTGRRVGLGARDGEDGTVGVEGVWVGALLEVPELDGPIGAARDKSRMGQSLGRTTGGGRHSPPPIEPLHGQGRYTSLVGPDRVSLVVVGPGRCISHAGTGTASTAYTRLGDTLAAIEANSER